MDQRRAPRDPQHGYWLELDETARQALTVVGQIVAVGPGGIVLAKGDPSGDVCIVRSGLVKVVIRSDRANTVLAVRGQGDILGDNTHVTGTPGAASVVAIIRVEVLRVPRAAFAAFLQRFPDAAEALGRTRAGRLRESGWDRAAVTTLAVRRRLARFLLKMVQRYGDREPDGAITIDGLSQSELAECIGCSPRTVAREIGSWRTRAIVSTGRRSVTVHQVGELKRIAAVASLPS
jgi:CRP/FNR family cyclic AMP-dependent transcriptional regulator